MLDDLTKFNYSFIWNAPYTPRFNPIEEVFGLIKNKLRQRNIKN